MIFPCIMHSCSAGNIIHDMRGFLALTYTLRMITNVLPLRYKPHTQYLLTSNDLLLSIQHRTNKKALIHRVYSMFKVLSGFRSNVNNFLSTPARLMRTRVFSYTAGMEKWCIMFRELYCRFLITNLYNNIYY